MGIMKYFTTALAALSTTVTAAQLEQVSNFGTNPSNVRMYIYVPDTLPANPAVIVAIHYCTGTAQAFYGGTQYATLADQHGYIVIYPESPYSGGCWDVSSDATLMRDGGGDSQGIASMVRSTLDQYSADASRVFVLGSSSGAMMTVSRLLKCVKDSLTQWVKECPRGYIPRSLPGRVRPLRRPGRLLLHRHRQRLEQPVLWRHPHPHAGRVGADRPRHEPRL